jgi:predicted RNase H-like nuclease (RuvC/YqgF family)
VQATLARATESGNARFRAAQQQINQWADDKVEAAEIELRQLKNQIRAMRREAESAETMQARQEAEGRVSQLERVRRRRRAEIFALEDEIEDKRRELISQLKQRIAQRSDVQELFTIRWGVE